MKEVDFQKGREPKQTRIAPLCEFDGFDILSSRWGHSTAAIAVGMMMMPSSGRRAGASVSVADGQT